ELDLHEPVVIDRLQKTFGELLNLREVDGLDVRRSPSKLAGMLALAAREQRAVRTPVPKEGAIGELLRAAARNNLLDEHLLRRDARQGFGVESVQLAWRVRAPRLGAGRVKEVFFHGRLQRERQTRLKRL